MSNDAHRRRLRRWEIIGFSAIALLVATDLVIDYREGASLSHLAAESLILIIAAAGAVSVWLQLERTRNRLSVVQAEANQWRDENRELVEGFSAAIASQFLRWKFTQAETEIGFLLLKGLSHKEVAKIRDTSERTVREQSRSLYRKSGMSGRAAFSAFFLEDIMPGSPPPTANAAGPEEKNSTT